MSTASSEQAAGGLVWRRRDGILEVLIAHRPRYDDWAFPKGKLDGGESLIECAVREVGEETGLACEVGRYLGVTHFEKPDGRLKEVSYWAMQVNDGAFIANDEVDETSWVPFSELERRLTYDIDTGFASSLHESWIGSPDRVLLIRHAHAGDRFRWAGEDDAQRPLSSRGRAQSGDITARLTAFPMDRLLTSPAVRCRETVQTMSKERNLTVEDTDLLWEGAAYEDVVGLLDESKVGSTAMCTHGPIVATVIHSLTGNAAGVPMEKASIWILDFSGESLAAANYLAPIEPADPLDRREV